MECAKDYRALLGEVAWRRLAPSVRERFAVQDCEAVYVGVMSKVWRSKMGALFAQCCRLIGTPLALHSEDDVPVEVRVYKDEQLGGLTWDRCYRYRNHAQNRVKSTKRVEKDGLVECVGRHFGMKLELSEKAGELCFTSRGYFFRFGFLKIPVPHWLSPGVTRVVQKDLGDGEFQFTLDIDHPWLGKTFHQKGCFRELRG